MTMPLCDGLRPGKNSASVFVFLHFFWMCAAVSIYIVFKLHKKKHPPPPSPPPPSLLLPQPSAWYNHYIQLVCCQLLFPFLNGGLGSLTKSFWITFGCFRLLHLFLPTTPTLLFIHLFLCLFHPFCSGKYPLKQMPLIPLAPHYKICPILRQGGGVRNKKSKEESPLSCFLFTHIYRRR